MSTQLKTRPSNHLSGEIAEPSSTPVQLAEVPPATHGIYNSRQQSLVLGNKIGVGGEGTVYDLEGYPDLVAKLYHEMPMPEKAEKLIAMAKLGTEQLFKISAWPVDVLRDRPDGNVIGFVMHKIGQAEEVHTLHSPKSRLQKFPDASWAFLLHVAANIARAIAALHEQGFVIGDVNPKNILVTKKATVYLLDCDSFQLSAAGKTYRCEGGFPEYTPPELQGVSFSGVDRTQEHDCFGLAVVIFQLLFLGRHPYSGRYAGASEMPLWKAIQEGRFAYGSDAAQRQMHPPPGTLSLDALPPTLTELLRQAFLASERPLAQAWIAPLTQLAQSLQRCVMHSGHYFYEALTQCPWCQLEARARLRLFNFNPTEARQYPSAFRLDEIWTEVQKLQWVETPEQHVTVRPHLAPDVIEYAKQRRIRFWLGIIFAALGGILTAQVGGFCAAFWLLPIVLLIVRWIAGTNKQREDKSMQTLFTAQFDLPDHPVAKRIARERKKAEDSISEIEQKLGGPKEKEAYVSQVNELMAKLETYETVAENDHRKFQLEHEITSTTDHLRQLKRRIETKQQQLLPTLTQAKQTVVEADKNLEVLSWRNSGKPMIIILILAFVLTLIWVYEDESQYWNDSPDRKYSGQYQPPPPVINSETIATIDDAPGTSEFERYYKEGKTQLRRGHLEAAKDSFLNASTFTDTGNWKQSYASLYYDLCRLRVKMKEAGPHIQYLEKQLALRDESHEEYRFSLILLYVLTGKNKKAAEEFQILTTNAPLLADSLNQVLHEHGISTFP